MANKDFNIRIRVDDGKAKVQIDGLTEGFVNVETAVSKLNAELKNNQAAMEGTAKWYKQQISLLKQQRDVTAKTAADYARQTKAIEKVQVKYRQLSSEVSQFTKVNQDQISNAGLAAATLTELGRTISDLPYGIRGVANNLSQLATLFFTLSGKVGGFGTSIRQLITQLNGPLGAILAFQALISLLDYFAGKQKEAKDSTEDLSESIKEQILLNINLADSIDTLNLSREEADAIVSSIVKTEKELKDIIDNKNLSEEERNKRIKEYLELRKQEEEINEKIEESQKELTRISGELNKNERNLTGNLQTLVNSLNAVYGANLDISDLRGKDIEQIKELNKQITGTVMEYQEMWNINDLLIDVSNSTDEYNQALLAHIELLKESNLTEEQKEKILSDSQGALFGTIRYYQDLIKELKTEQETVATTTERYKELQVQIDRYQANIDELKGSVKELGEMSVEELTGLSGSFYGEFFRSSQELNKNLANLSKQRRAVEFAEIGRVLQEEITALKARSFTRQEFENGREKLIREALKKEIDLINFALQYDRLTTQERIKLKERLASAEGQLIDITSDKIIESAEQALRHFEFILDAFQAKNDAEISIEERRTVIANNQLKKRLANEKLSAKERENINNKIAANEEALQKKRDKIAERNFKLQKTVSIAQTLIRTAEMAADAFGTIKGMSFLGVAALPLAKLAAATATAFGLAQVDAIRRTQFVPSASSSAGSGGAGAGGAGAGVQAPDFNIVGASAQSQLAEAVATAESQPVRAFVVGKDISTQQELDRNITNTASFG